MSVKIEQENVLPPITITIDGEDAAKWRNLFINKHLGSGCLSSLKSFTLCQRSQEILDLIYKIGDAMRFANVRIL
jgi:hypothetical protein